MFLSVYVDFSVIVSEYLINIFFGINILATYGIIWDYSLLSVFMQSSARHSEYIRNFGICQECIVV